MRVFKKFTYVHLMYVFNECVCVCMCLFNICTRVYMCVWVCIVLVYLYIHCVYMCVIDACVFESVNVCVGFIWLYPIYPTPPLGQDMTQGQFLSRVWQVWIQSFPSSCLTKAEEPSLSYYLPIAGGRIIGFIPFPRVLVLCEVQSVSSRIWHKVWTRVAVSNSYDDNNYTTGTSRFIWLYMFSCVYSVCVLKSCVCVRSMCFFNVYIFVCSMCMHGYVYCVCI